MPEKCQWNRKVEDERSDVYTTSCDHEFMFYDGTFEENGYKFCPYCGKEIELVD